MTNKINSLLDFFNDSECSKQCGFKEITEKYVKCNNPYCKQTFKIQIRG